jgi:hypothetical protein
MIMQGGRDLPIPPQSSNSASSPLVPLGLAFYRRRLKQPHERVEPRRKCAPTATAHCRNRKRTAKARGSIRLGGFDRNRSARAPSNVRRAGRSCRSPMQAPAWTKFRFSSLRQPQDLMWPLRKREPRSSSSRRHSDISTLSQRDQRQRGARIFCRPESA